MDQIDRQMPPGREQLKWGRAYPKMYIHNRPKLVEKGNNLISEMTRIQEGKGKGMWEPAFALGIFAQPWWHRASGEQAEPMPAWRRRWHQRLLRKAKPPKGQLSKQNRSYPAKGDRKRTYLPQPQLWPQKENKNECPAWELLNRSPRSHASAAGIHRLPTQPSALRAHYSVQSGPDPSCI